MIDRRTLLGAAIAAIPVVAAVAAAKPGRSTYRKIATEEAFAVPEWFAAMAAIPASSPDKFEAELLGGIHAIPAIHQGLADIDYRLKGMDQAGVDMHLLSLTSPGVQSFDSANAASMARLTNDYMAAVIARHPKRFAGLATVAPQDVPSAVAEIHRSLGELKLNGILLNSYTNGAYLDEPQFEPLLAAIAERGAPLYLHPRIPAPAMVQPYKAHGMTNAIWGFAADTGLHAMRMIMGGVFDRHPNLTVVLGHMGEAIPYWFWRIDNMYKKARSAPGSPKLKKLPSEYFRDNFYITTSGVNSHANLKFAIELLGADRIMFAIDYPFESSLESVDFLDTAPITDSDREKIAYRNAERVFGITQR
ncbi:amidohydrolase [Pseudomonas sp. PAMC 29040]|uniref:amidohydrolase family protein n=1 Tax=Pseudomonas sp. PAMC 29040 TaxID=2498450 RepID=UPI000FB274EF|nr:amidohydrolase family protein [Pseudomonas sp. PAMC 29040]RUT42400.1 amidohydrolase [Pseudomonas sp. PAMC 29040]